MGERCTECGDHTSVPYCPGCRIKELDERERETIARVVAWLRAHSRKMAKLGTVEHMVLVDTASRIEEGYWRNDDG